jgi:nitroreductase/NAD-dependent dihydropyrimidine dehydrogenase PreA subunit
MVDIIVSKDKCIKCGLCAKECGNDVLKWEKGCFPVVENAHFCIECGRCMARCMSDAIRVGTLPADKFFTSAPADIISPNDMELFLTSKRSCRLYENRPVEREVLERLLDIAQAAPTAMNTLEKTFIVIQDPKKIDGIRKTILKQAKKTFSMVCLFSGRLGSLIFPKETVEAFKHMKIDFQLLLDHAANGDDSLFHGAPCLVLFTGIGMDANGKDNALAAMHYFMLQAETIGLGTCINGFCSTSSKVLAKLIDVPRFYKIFGVITLGYSASRFAKTICRKAPKAQWL